MQKNKATHITTGILLIAFVIVFVVVAGRFLYIQATGEVDGISLKDWADKQRTDDYTLHAQRGEIVDRNGMTLANERPVFEMYAILDEEHSANSENPLHVVDPDKTAEKLSSVLDAEKQDIKDRIQEGIEEDKFQVEFGNIGKDIPLNEKEKIEDMGLAGINFHKDYIRYYPNGQFASHVIGLAKNGEEDNIIGQSGIESERDDILSGKEGHISYQRDKYGTELLDPEEVVSKPQDGDDIRLTIDQKIQTLLEDALSRVNETYEPKRMNAIIMDPETGEIVAMSSRPSYDPNHPVEVGNWYNDTISTPFDPGSTMKIFTWAAAMEEGVYNGDEAFTSGKYKAEERIQTIHDHNNGEGWGDISFDEGFIRSSNVGAARLAWEKIGPETFLDYLHAFDFHEKTGIDLPGEVPGKLLYNWGIEKITTSFGQGTMLTPIQQMKAASAVANGGKMLKPYVIDEVVDGNTDKVLEKSETEVAGEPISEETADQMLDLMESVVEDDNGTGNSFKLDDYTVAGKTGTSQIPDATGSQAYLTGKENHIFSFLGMAPKDDPELMMYVSVQQPNLGEEEVVSLPVSFVFTNVMENSLQYLNIAPDKEEENPVKMVDVGKLAGKNTEDVKKTLSEKGLQVTAIGSGDEILETNVDDDSELFQNDRVLLLTGNPTMPDIQGWSRRNVSELGKLLDIPIDVSGSGYVVEQNIDEGTDIPSDTTLEVQLEPPEEVADQDE